MGYSIFKIFPTSTSVSWISSLSASHSQARAENERPAVSARVAADFERGLAAREAVGSPRRREREMRRLFVLWRTGARAEGALACCSDSCSSHYRRHPPSPLLLSPLSDLLIESRPQFPSSLCRLPPHPLPLSASFCSFHRIVGPKYITCVATLKSRPLSSPSFPLPMRPWDRGCCCCLSGNLSRR